MTDSASAYDRFLERYQAGRVPWDEGAPPPEIEALAAGLPAGRALDLGCGYGRAIIYLAARGWTGDGVDFIPQAVREARRRAVAAGVADRAHFHVASATALSFLRPGYDLVIDVGCMHSFTGEMLADYRDEVARLVRPGGLYMLFAHLRDEAEAPGEEGRRGIPEDAIYRTLGDAFALERLERGMTQVEDKPAWRSGWFWFRRQS
jgi:SAM-dependent methyltransferase